MQPRPHAQAQGASQALGTRYEDLEPGGEPPWLDRPGALAAVDAKERAGELSAAEAEICRHWHENGWAVLGRLVDNALVEAVRADIWRIVETHRHEPFDGWKIQLQNMYETSANVRAAMCHPQILDCCRLLLGTRALPFQSLSMPIGSQIPPHADQVLMTTHPPGYMLAVWIALEDVTLAAGPLTLWSKSHRLPYLSAREVGIPRDADDAECSRIYGERYYALNAQRIAEHGFVPFYFTPRRGEVLLWHSNLLHGGKAIEDPSSTRTSLVVHYFGEGVHHYSDLFHRQCVIPKIAAPSSRPA